MSQTISQNISCILLNVNPRIVLYMYNCACKNPSLLQDGQTALMLAASSGSLELVNILIECGADVNLQNKVSNDCGGRGVCSWVYAM